jgi:hypothetical protein
LRHQRSGNQKADSHASHTPTIISHVQPWP